MSDTYVMNPLVGTVKLVQVISEIDDFCYLHIYAT